MEVDSLAISGAAQTPQPAVYKSQTEDAPSVKQTGNAPAAETAKAEITNFDTKTTSDFVQKLIDKANKQLTGANLEFDFSVHKKTGQFMIKIIDTETHQVIKEIPPEKTLDALAKMWEMAGLFVDKKF